MTIIAITARKGGVGKTTITGNLAAELTERGHKVRVLDADPQQSLIGWAGLGTGLLSRISEAVDMAHPKAFEAAVQRAAKAADVVLIDTPPSLTDPALVSALLADIVLLPAGPSPLDVMALQDTLEIVRQARKQRGGRKPIIRLVPSRLLPRARLSQELPQSLRALGEEVLPGYTVRAAVAAATLEGLTVAEYAASSTAREEFRALARAVEKLL